MKYEKLDDIDHCIVFFNQAVVFYHQRQYSDALKIIDRIYKFIEPMGKLRLQLCDPSFN